ncbi:chaperone protein DnaJ [Nitzschia inconspicua]|uniref:Chaperone protein DnaJ n=1 Tax=Nitzschia inconspicua TaxID=303405 RepID=A0A9K3LYA4_9STRA|nr:chaperone protein DnaJ [Nitzschia inconspicua]
MVDIRQQDTLTINTTTSSTGTATIAAVGTMHKSSLVSPSPSSSSPLSSTWYDILQVSSHASTEEIKTAFYRLALKYHPDKQQQQQQQQPNQQDYSTSMFVTIQNAWHVLRDEQRRKHYDEELLQKRLQHTRKRDGAIELSLQELQPVIDDETNESFYVYDCRCGEEIPIDLQQPNSTNDASNCNTNNNNNNNETNTMILIDCPSCCFVYKITITH